MSDPTDQDAPGYRPTARDNALEAMAEAQHNKLLETGDLVEPDAPAVTVEPAPAPEPAPEPKAEDQVAKQMRKIKVEGAEIEVSDDDLVASYRHQETTRRAMQTAQQARAEAERVLAEARAEAERIKALPKHEPSPDRAAKVQEYHDALVSGDMDTANRLFDEVMATGRQESPPDVNALVAQAAPLVKQAVKQELSNESALERFTTDFKDIVDDPSLVAITKTRLQDLMAEGKPYAEALFEAGKSTRDWLKSKGIASVPSGQPTTTRAEKLDKKAGIVQFPTANAKAASAEEREQTDSEYIAEMRKRRGLG